MSEKSTRIFLDQSIEQSADGYPGGVLLPSRAQSDNPKGKVFLSPLVTPLSLTPSFDARLREALKPVISDISVIKPQKYDQLLKETQAALLEQMKNECADETKEALTDLLTLLRENTQLATFLDQFRNHIQKA